LVGPIPDAPNPDEPYANVLPGDNVAALPDQHKRKNIYFIRFWTRDCKQCGKAITYKDNWNDGKWCDTCAAIDPSSPPLSPDQMGIARNTIDILTNDARRIMSEARAQAKASLEDTRTLEQLITFELTKFGITTNDISVRYENDYDMGAWYLTGSFEIPPDLDDLEAIEAFETALPQWCSIISPGQCKSSHSSHEIYSRHESRMWVYGPCSTAIRLETAFTSIY